MPRHLHLALRESEDGDHRRPQFPITVVLADDHAQVRRSLRLLLQGEEGLDVVGEAADLDMAARHVHGHAPHVLVLDLQMPGGSGIETIRRLRQECPETQIVVLTMERSPAFAQRALDTGASGFVLKDRADTELPEAVRRTAGGEEFVSPYVAAALDALRRTENGHGLSLRETEVLRLIALGYTSAEIAGRLHLSRRTVETHRATIYRKLGLDRRSELVHFALRRHLIG
ncbi:MAG TPA: response regulator transcription factor [Solirubrobacteraceae bacterium]|nr:response regulator transcription factor [Solirubrobacteraceae bacterium]